MATRNPNLNIVPSLKKALGSAAANGGVAAEPNAAANGSTAFVKGSMAANDELLGERGDWWWTGKKPSECPGFDSKQGVLRCVGAADSRGHMVLLAGDTPNAAKQQLSPRDALRPVVHTRCCNRTAGQLHYLNAWLRQQPAPWAHASRRQRAVRWRRACAPPQMQPPARRSLPLPNSTTATRQQAIDYFDNCWTLTEVLLACLQGEPTNRHRPQNRTAQHPAPPQTHPLPHPQGAGAVDSSRHPHSSRCLLMPPPQNAHSHPTLLLQP